MTYEIELAQADAITIFNEHKNKLINYALSIFFLSFSILGYEIFLIRVLSVIFKYDLLFIIISLSILGLGLGGILAFFISQKKITAAKSIRNISFFLFPLSFIFSIWSLTTYFDILKIPGSVLVSLIPFLIAGLIISTIFSENTKKSPLLYFFDLIGGAAGCVFSLLFMYFTDAINSILLVAFFSSFSTLLLNQGKKYFLPAVITLFCLFINLKSPFITLGLSDLIKTSTPLGQILTYKGIRSQWLASSWDLYSRCDLVKSNKDDMKRSIFINGGTQAVMMRFDNEEPTKIFLNDFINSSLLFFPYLYGSNEKVLNIGSGGGLDVLMATLAGAGEITAVEINKGVINMVRSNSEFNGNIYGQPNVRLVNEDGRTFIMRSKENYNRIVLSLASTFAFSDINSLAQMENYLYTKEAFKEYVSHLTNDGSVVIFIDFPELVEKFIFTFTEVITEMYGISVPEAMKYIAAFETEYFSGYGYAIIVRKTPFSAQNIAELTEISKGYKLKPVHLPYESSENDFDQVEAGTLTPSEYIANNNANLSPSTDDSPFFLEVVYNNRSNLINLLTFVVIVVLLIIIGFQYTIINQASAISESIKRKELSLLFLFTPFFLLIGVGFMLVEILLTKRFSFYLGYPHLNISVILFTILLGTGIGSLISGKIKDEELEQKTAFVALFLVAGILIYDFSANTFIEKTISYSLYARAAIITLYLLPLSTLLGFFFPAGVRIVGNLNHLMVPWFWGINGIASVAGSIMSVVISMQFGFHMVLITGALCYLIAAFLLFYIGKLKRELIPS